MNRSRYVPLPLAILVVACGSSSAGSVADTGNTADSGTSDDATSSDSSSNDAPIDAPTDSLADSATDAPTEAASDAIATDSGATITLPAGTAHLTFDDEFDAAALDDARWNRWYRFSPSIINSELQFYAPDAFEFATGKLRIRGDKRAMYGQSYSSGVITTLGSFSQAYGYFEMRAQLPAGKGLWPAFWLLPEAAVSTVDEIDTFEVLGDKPGTAYFTYHWTDSAGKSQDDGSSYAGADLSAGMHTYAIDWRPGVLVWYLDGVERKRLTGTQVSAHPMYILANLAIGGGWPGAPDATTTFPAYYDIDYIRAYQYDSIAAGTSIPIDVAITTADSYAPAAGSTVKLATHVTFDPPPTGPLQLQVTLTSDTASAMAATSQSFTVPAPIGSTIAHDFSIALPSTMAPGLYRVSVGIFKGDWSSNLFWIDTSTELTVH